MGVPIVDPVDTVEDNEDWRRNPHGPSINVVNYRLFTNGKAYRNLQHFNLEAQNLEICFISRVYLITLLLSYWNTKRGTYYLIIVSLEFQQN